MDKIKRKLNKNEKSDILTFTLFRVPLHSHKTLL